MIYFTDDEARYNRKFMKCNMQAHRIETTISQDGKLSIKGIPFRKGDKVEVIVLPQEKKSTDDYPLRGQPFTYHKPYHSVAEEDWETLK